MTDNNFRTGDRVSIPATVMHGDDLGCSIEIDGLGAENFWILNDRLTLVERPKRTVTIELDEDEAKRLWREVSGISPNLRSRVFSALEELDS